MGAKKIKNKKTIKKKPRESSVATRSLRDVTLAIHDQQHKTLQFVVKTITKAHRGKCGSGKDKNIRHPKYKKRRTDQDTSPAWESWSMSYGEDLPPAKGCPVRRNAEPMHARRGRKKKEKKGKKKRGQTHRHYRRDISSPNITGC